MPRLSPSPLHLHRTYTCSSTTSTLCRRL
jgi:hypothetical protein